MTTRTIIRAALAAGAALLAGCGSETASRSVATPSSPMTTGVKVPAKRSQAPVHVSLGLPGASQRQTTAANAVVATLAARCGTLPFPGGVVAMGPQRAAQRMRTARQMLENVAGPPPLRRLVRGLVARMNELGDLYLRAGEKPGRRLAALRTRKELTVQSEAASLGLAACGPVGRS